MSLITFIRNLFRKKNKKIKMIENQHKKRVSLFSKVLELFNKQSFEMIENSLLKADMDYATATSIIEEMKLTKDFSEDSLHNILDKRIVKDSPEFKNGSLTVLFVMGINGVGKTTIIGKIANYYKNAGKRILISAADTYRAAAIEQLVHWADKLDLPYVAQKTGADPASVVFDSIEKAVKGGYDLCIVDTAGRLHNKDELMNQLKKIDKVIERKKEQYPDIIVHKTIVLDANLGKNSMVQFETFHELVDLNSFSVTKLDSTAKGGIIFSICSKYKLPLCFASYGENIEALKTSVDDNFKDFIVEKI